MNRNYNISATIVLYNNDLEKLNKAIQSFLNVEAASVLYLVDNSPTKIFEGKFKHPKIDYVYTGQNLGFGNGHNYILEKLNSDFHIILNPDVYFEAIQLEKMIEKLIQNKEVGVLGPKVLFPNGDLQPSIRKFPTVFDLLIRRSGPFKKFFQKRIESEEYLDQDINEITRVDYVLGCFQLFKTPIFKELKGFDPRYFMYLEDIDICKEVYKHGYTVWFSPDTPIYHYYERASSKNLSLFIAHIKSAFQYFYKWK